MPTLEAGIRLKDRYQITSQLGHGGMGEVYLAIDESLDNQVAVKANHNLSAHASAQFIKEARLLASLKHPNLPRVIDYFTEGESQYLVMDFIPGEDLKTLVENHQTFSIPQIQNWAQQLGNALTYLHTQNPPIYHRDIKPANIKVTPSGEVVLVDFGIAKTGDASQETQTGAWAFTPGFAPPEQVSGMRTGPYSDQFSLAATIYYLVAGKSPADSARRLMGEEELVPLAQFNANIPQHFSNAISKALAIKPDARYSTVADFVGALLNPTPIPDPASSQRTVIGTHASIPPSMVPPSAQAEAVAPAPQIHKKNSVLWIILGIGAALGVLTGGFFTLRSMGFIGTPNTPANPTITPENVIVPLITETQEIIPTETATETEVVAPTETITPTVDAASFTKLSKGGRVAFVSNRQADGYDQIWTMMVMKDSTGNIIATDFQQLTFSEGNKSNPSWSPDGSKIIYSGLSTEFSNNGTPFADDIWMLDVTQENAQPVDISRMAGDDRYASWSPAGDLIAFTNYSREDKIPQLFTVNPEGTKFNLLQDPDTKIVYSDSYSTWTPNGEWLLYVYSTGNLNVLQMRDRYTLYEKFKKFDRTTNEGRLGRVADPNVSMDGTTIVYTRLFDDGTTNIYSAAFVDRGSTVTKLTDSGKDYAACWSPDSKWILFSSERDGDAEIYLMDPTGAQIVNLTNLPSMDKEPSWQPPQPE